MAATEDVQENPYLEKALAWATKKGFKEFKSNHEDHEDPFVFTNKQNNEEVIPDITATKDGRKSYIEVALKNDEVTKTVSKWRLLSTMAQMKGGKLYLLAPRGHKAFTDGIISQYPIDAKIVTI